MSTKDVKAEATVDVILILAKQERVTGRPPSPSSGSSADDVADRGNRSRKRLMSPASKCLCRADVYVCPSRAKNMAKAVAVSGIEMNPKAQDSFAGHV